MGVHQLSGKSKWREPSCQRGKGYPIQIAFGDAQITTGMRLRPTEIIGEGQGRGKIPEFFLMEIL